ncbi:MAG: cation ABC transporter substrate-binding protein [Anaerolineaceae bacterium]|nr:cation ABC transporter substrate-binding protein [Anaerolineaceae bacterium]
MKNKTAFPRFFILLIAVLILSACSGNVGSDNQKPIITVSVLPQQYFVERLAGDYFAVNVMVQPGESPENYEPTPQQMRALSSAAAYISIGVPFENVWLDKIASANPNMVMVDSTVGVEKLPITGHDHADEDHVGEELDPHIWTSPRLVKIQAQNIADALTQLDPTHESEYKANLDSFLKDINQLDTELTDLFAGSNQKKFMIFHPSLGYFANDYGLTQIPIEIGGTEPSAQELAQFIKLAKDENVHIIFVQPEFSKRSAETIAAEINAKVVELFVLSPDWLNNLRSIGQTIAEMNQ